jgi:hypothetical protein
MLLCSPWGVAPATGYLPHGLPVRELRALHLGRSILAGRLAVTDNTQSPGTGVGSHNAVSFRN